MKKKILLIMLTLCLCFTAALTASCKDGADNTPPDTDTWSDENVDNDAWT